MFTYLVFMLTLSYIYGESCPDRMDIYPCLCVQQIIGRSTYGSMILCRGLTDAGPLKNLEYNLSSTLDLLLFYDFYPHRSINVEPTERLPVNFLSTLRAKEIKVVDSELSTFTCPQHSDYCRSDYVKRFTAINTTVVEHPDCTSVYSWISCSESIEFIEIIAGYTNNHTLKPDFFPDPLTSLKELHMPYNHITRIDRRTFHNSKFPVLEVLDLSHNLIRDIRTQFISELKVQYLDLSYNYIRNVVEFEYFPELRLLNLSNNHIMMLLHNNWINTPEKLKIIDLTKNYIDCNCGNKWVNSTFHVSTNLMGHCASPSQVANMKLRKASRLLIQRCHENGTISASKIRSTTPSTLQ